MALRNPPAQGEYKLMLKVIDIQFRGLRRIPNMEHTYANRANTSTKASQVAKSAKSPNGAPRENIRQFQIMCAKGRRHVWKMLRNLPLTAFAFLSIAMLQGGQGGPSAR